MSMMINERDLMENIAAATRRGITVTFTYNSEGDTYDLAMRRGKLAYDQRVPASEPIFWTTATMYKSLQEGTRRLING